MTLETLDDLNHGEHDEKQKDFCLVFSSRPPRPF
jgi:hypothetical protein